MDQVHMMDGIAGGAGGNPPSSADNNNVTMEAFIVDSGASAHATGDRRVFSQLSVIVQPESSTAATRRSRAHVRVANGEELPVHGYGTVRRDHITLHGVLFVPGLAKNIVSVPKLAERGYTVEFTRTRCFIRDSLRAIIGKASLVNGLYELDFLQDPCA